MPFPSSLQQLGIGLEATRGTVSAGPYIYIPVKAPSWTPNPVILPVTGLIGDMNAIQGQGAGQRSDDFTFGCDVFADSFPHLIRAALGSADTKIGTTAPYTHAFSLLNTGSGQPPSYTLQYFDGLDANQFLACQLDTLNMTWTSDGLLSTSPKYVCNPATTISLTTPVYSAEVPIPAWDAVVTVGGTPITKAVSGEFIIGRGTKPIPAVTGTQAYYQNFAGSLVTDASKLTVVMETDTEINYFLNNTLGVALDFKFTNPASTTEYIQFHYSTVGWTKAVKNPGKEWMEVDLEFRGLPSTTDATAGGRSPMKVTISNAVATSY